MKTKYLLLIIPVVLVIGALFFIGRKVSRLVATARPGGDIALAADSFAGKPIPSGAAAFTEKDLQKIRRQYYNKLVLDAYQGIGLKQPGKTAEETALLKRFVTYLSDIKDTPELPALVQPLLKSNPQDPMVLCAIGLALRDEGRSQEAATYLQKALAAFPKTKYAKTFYWKAPLFLSGLYTGNPDKKAEINELIGQAVKWVGEGAVYPFGEYEQRVFWEAFSYHLSDDTPPERRQQLVDAFANQPKADPWLQHMMAGYHEFQSAWEARGGGWASEVTRAGWQGYSRHLKPAGEHFTAAWQLHPKYPEPAAYMTEIAMEEHKASGTPREWFDRAVAGQMDYMPAYSNFALSLQPRWGGSHEAMYNFGLEALTTKRFDTEVPEMYFEMVKHIYDLDGDASYWRRPGVFANMEKLFQGLIAEPSRKDEIPHNETLLFLAAWRGGNYAAARKVLDETNGGLVDRTIWHNVRINPEWLKGEVYLRSGAAKARFEQAESDIAKREFAKALAIFEDLQAQRTEPKAEQYLHHRIVSTRVARDLQTGDWVPLPIENNLPGWQDYAGSWAMVDNSAITMVQGELRPSLLLCSPVGKDFEASGEVDFLGGDPTLAAGIVIDYKLSASADSHQVFIHRNGVIGIRPDGAAQDTEGKVETPKDRYSFLVQVKNGKATVAIDGKEIVSEWIKKETYPANMPGYFGLTVVPPVRGGGNNLVRFRNLKIRQL